MGLRGVDTRGMDSFRIEGVRALKLGFPLLQVPSMTILTFGVGSIRFKYMLRAVMYWETSEG